MGPADILRSYLGAVRDHGKVLSVTVWVPNGEGAGFDALWLNSGGAPPPELASESNAQGGPEGLPSGLDSIGAAQRIEVLPSSDPDCCILRKVVRPRRASGDDAEARGRRRGDSVELLIASTTVLIGLRFAPGTCPLERDKDLDSQIEANPDLLWWRFSIGSTARLAAQVREVVGVLSDPVTGVGGRAQLQGRLARAFSRATKGNLPLSLLLVSPDDFAMVNQRFGHQKGDRVLREIALTFRSALRKSDFAARYGGAIFAAVLEDANRDASALVAEKLVKELQGRRYHRESLTLRFRAAIATLDPESGLIKQPLELTVQAEEALFQARRSSGQTIVHWSPDLEKAGDPDALSGVFTGNMAKDYRNMQLLAEIVKVVAASSSYHDLARLAVERLEVGLKPDQIGLFECSSEDSDPLELHLIHGRGHEEETDELIVSSPDLAQRAVALGRPTVELVASDGGVGVGDARSCCAIPLSVGEGCLGAIYLEGSTETFLVDGTDVVFFRSLASQLAVALDRAKLSALEQERRELEAQRLRAEVEGLRQAVEEANLEYRSESMESVMATVRRVAPTDATVLITGESGTGKDLVARTVHRSSGRRNRLLQVVDCAAIPATLIESELFGHEKGAFSGADQRRIGRLEQADGATVFLDEIGELPLEVQSKLLRFVQEKELSRVGATETRSVDVRVVAATNRDLMAEVKAGRFREDLYYRLNVVRLGLPPLRERPDDILHLAYHYLRTYSLLYSKPVVSLTPEAEALLVGHSWPGNVRELQNRVQQAVILAEGSAIGPEALRLDGRETENMIASGGPVIGGATEGAPPGAPVNRAEGHEEEPVTRSEAVSSIRELLAQRIDGMVAGEHPLLPLGEWLADDLVLAADDAENGTASRAAARLGMAETTFRRRRSKANLRADAGLSPRPPWWTAIRSRLRVIAGPGYGGPAEGVDLDGLLEGLLLEEVARRPEVDRRSGAAILGVTTTTYRRRLERLGPPQVAANDSFAPEEEPTDGDTNLSDTDRLAAL